MGTVCIRTHKHINRMKKHIETYFEDVRQDEKHVPDLLEAIIQPPGLAKAELRPILFKITQIESKITKTKNSAFWI